MEVLGGVPAVPNMVLADVPEPVAMQLTGHKTRSALEHYNVVSEGDLDAAAVHLNGIMGVARGKDKNKSTDQMRGATSPS